MHRIKHWTRKLHDEYFKLFYGKPNSFIPRVIEGPITWSFYQRGLEREKIQHFISYTQNIYKQPVNSKNTLFVTGPKGSGKSWLLKNNCKNSIVIDNIHCNFESFFEQMKQEIIKYVCNQKLITPEEVLQIATKKYLPEYLDIYFNQYIRDRLDQNERDKLKAFRKQTDIESLDWETGELDFWKEDALQITQNLQNPFSFEVGFINLAQMIDNNLENSSIQLMLEMIQQIEIDKLNNPIKITSTIAAKQQIDFLFDILNYISGFTKDSVKKHEISLILMNIDKITEYYRYDMEAYDFFDHLILRTYNMTGIRNHFPVVIESSDSKFFNRDMMEMMNVELNTVLHLDILDIGKEQIQVQVEGIFTQEEIDLIYDKIGGSLQDWHLLTKEAVTNKEFNFENWLNKFTQIENGKFNHKMNQVVTNNEISDLLDNHKIDSEIFRIMNAFNEFKGIMFTGNYYADTVLMENPVVHALQQERILHHPKYISHIFYSKKIYYQYCKKYLERKKQSIQYWPEPEKDSDLLVSAFKLKKKERGEYLVQIPDEPRKYIYDDIRKEERPYHEYYI